jgi:hypothetical protein
MWSFFKPAELKSGADQGSLQADPSLHKKVSERAQFPHAPMYFEIISG